MEFARGSGCTPPVVPVARHWYDSAWRVTTIYLFCTLATTWPLVTRLAAVPADLGDSLLNAWILSWGADHLLDFVGGNLRAFEHYWNAPIFHPEPLSLAYSEHLFAQVVQIAPLYALTGNIVLCYNLLFLSTFVLSGLGMYLLVRELTGKGIAGFVAGLLYAFALYRLAQYPHVQVLSSHWFPFALFGLRRFFVTRRWAPLAGATAAIVAQNLSCGYYLIFFAPFIAAYCIYEVSDRRLWRDVRTLAGVAIAGAVTILCTLPFLTPYLSLRAAGFPPRPVGEVVSYSADLYSWVTTTHLNRVWGRLQTFMKAEGELFPGVVLPLLAAAGLLARGRTLWRWSESASRPERWRTVVVGIVLAAMVVVTAFAGLVLVTGDANWTFAGARFRLRQPWKAGFLLAALAAVVVAVLPRVRAIARGVPGSAFGFFAIGAVVSAWLALGPIIEIGGMRTELPALYAALYTYVPGFDGLRVPARYVMLTLCCLSVVAGFGVRALLARGRVGTVAILLLTTVFLVESTGSPIPLNLPMNAGIYQSGPREVFVGRDVPAIYRFAATLPRSSVIIEFPFGPTAWELQYVFYQRAHRHPIVNGYSGGFPASFDDNLLAFGALTTVPRAAWMRLRASGATHAIVHRDAYGPGQADPVEQWLIDHGATLLRASHGDRMYALPR